MTRSSIGQYLWLQKIPFGVFLLSLASVTVMLLFSLGSLLLLLYPKHALGASDATPEALNPQLTNTIPDNGGPVLYYNGSGPVPPSVAPRPSTGVPD